MSSIDSTDSQTSEESVNVTFSKKKENDTKQLSHDAPSDSNKRKEKNTLNLSELKPISFPLTPERLKEVERLRQVMSSPTLNIPILAVKRQEDALPLLSLYMEQEKKSNAVVPTYMIVTPESLGIKYFDEENAWEMSNQVRENMKELSKEFRETLTYPVFHGIREYADLNMIGDFAAYFLKKDSEGILIVEQEDLNDIHRAIRGDTALMGGIENFKAPYEREGFAKCVVQNVMPMTDAEKRTYFATHLKKMAIENGMKVSKESFNAFIDAINARFSHENVFSKAFEVFDKALVLAQAENQSLSSQSAKPTLSKKILMDALDQVAPLHNQSEALVDMDDRLKKKIFGQDKAINQVYEAILSVCDDADRTKPVVMGFFGPSGVGKTATAEELSLAMTGKPVSCINMSEYADDFKMSILIGSSKGYVDSDQDGLLAKIVKDNPKAVILLDEFEKAHPKVQRMFLGLFDKGSLYDNHAGEMDFSGTTIVLTSNAGVKSEGAIGLVTGGNRRYVADMNLIQQAFPPELLGRIDAKVLFEPLTHDAMGQIVDKFMDKFSPRFKQLGVDVRLSEKAREELIEKGQDPTAGARPLLNILRQKVKTPVEIGVLKKTIRPGSRVVVNSVEKTNLQVLEVVPIKKHQPKQPIQRAQNER